MATNVLDNWRSLQFVGGEFVGSAGGTMRTPGAAEHLPTAQVELSISAQNLLDLDITSKSDPQCIVYMRDAWRTNYFEIGRTEIVNDNLNPNFIKKIVLNYNFETVQTLKFELWDIDPGDREFLGQAECTLADIVAHKGRQFRRPLVGHQAGRDCGTIIVVVEELTANKQILSCQFKAYDLKKTCPFFINNDPFLLFWKSNEDGTYSVVHKSEVVRSTQRPTFKSFNAKIRTLCNGDLDRAIRVDCMDQRLNGNHKLIGSFFTTINQLVGGGSTKENSYTLKKPTSRKNSDKPRGTVELISVSLTEELSFLDYIRGGLAMHFAIALDFTASNGPISDPNSLHYLDPMNRRPTNYEVALRAVGDIVSQYDTQGLFPSFGFGAKVPPQMSVSHQFALNGNGSHPYCASVDEIVHCYKQTLQQVVLYGPTNFAPASIARQYQNGQSYFVLLIITDGIICDMEMTKHAIVGASALPMSIIICGVGNADFTAMDELDSDDALLTINGKTAVRDIVQFVPMNRFLTGDGNWMASKADLAREVLYEIPEQIVGYMQMRGFRPKPITGGQPAAPPLPSPKFPA